MPSLFMSSRASVRGLSPLGGVSMISHSAYWQLDSRVERIELFLGAA